MEDHPKPKNGPGVSETMKVSLGRYQVAFAPRTLARRLLIAALTLIGVHLALAVYHYKIEELPWLALQMFDLDEENNLPTWFSGFILLISTALLWTCARQKKTDGDRWHTRWAVLAGGFFVLSIDEIAGIHETINSIIEMTWAIPGGILAVVLGIMFIPFLRSLPRRTALMLMVAGVIYVGGAVGMEFVGDPLESDSFEYYMSTMVEEGMEILGVLLLIQTMIQYMSGDHAETSPSTVD